MLIKDGVTTDERLIVPECVHTVTMQWYSVHYLDHVSNIMPLYVDDNITISL